MERQIYESQRRVINAVIVWWAKALEGPSDGVQKLQREDVTAQVIQEQGHKEAFWGMESVDRSRTSLVNCSQKAMDCGAQHLH